MKCIIAGGRDFIGGNDDLKMLDILDSKYGISEVISGGCRGADRFGERWARLRNKKLTVFKADWEHHGKAAGPIRNRRMAEYGELCILFPGGNGTDSMKKLAVEYKLIVEIIGEEIDE